MGHIGSFWIFWDLFGSFGIFWDPKFFLKGSSSPYWLCWAGGSKSSPKSCRRAWRPNPSAGWLWLSHIPCTVSQMVVDAGFFIATHYRHLCKLSKKSLWLHYLLRSARSAVSHAFEILNALPHGWQATERNAGLKVGVLAKQTTWWPFTVRSVFQCIALNLHACEDCTFKGRRPYSLRIDVNQLQNLCWKLTGLIKKLCWLW